MLVDAPGGEVELVEREHERLPPGVRERIRVTVRWSDPLAVGDRLLSEYAVYRTGDPAHGARLYAAIVNQEPVAEPWAASRPNARIGIATGDRISIHVPLSEACQHAARDLVPGSASTDRSPSWIVDVVEAIDPVSRLVAAAHAREVDACSWPPVALLIGGYPPS